MQISVNEIMITLNVVFFICFSIFSPAERISHITQTCIPLKAYATRVSERKASKNSDMAYMMTKDGIQTATVAVSEPRKPSIL